MASYTTYNQVIDILKDIAKRHLQINTFFLGKDYDLENSEDIVFPLFAVHPTLARMPRNVDGEYKTIEINLECKVLDLETQSQSNERDVQSDMLQVAQDIINEINQNPYFNSSNVSITNDIQLEALDEFEDDLSAGWSFNLSLQLINHNSFCGLPFTPIDGITYNGASITGYSYTHTFGCDDLVDCPIIIDLGNDISQINSILSGLTGSTVVPSLQQVTNSGNRTTNHILLDDLIGNDAVILSAEYGIDVLNSTLDPTELFKVDRINDKAYYKGYELSTVNLIPNTPNLQTVTSVGNLTTNPIIIDKSGLGGHLQLNNATDANGYIGIDFNGDTGLIGQFISSNSNFSNQGFKSGTTSFANYSNGVSLIAGNIGANIELYAGGYALSDLIASISNTGVTVESGKIINSSNGGGQIDLDYANVGMVMLSTDGGVGATGYMYAAPTGIGLSVDGDNTELTIAASAVSISTNGTLFITSNSNELHGNTKFYSNVSLNNNRLTGLPVATGSSDAVRYSQITGFTLFDIYTTGGTYSNGTATFTNNTGGTFSISGFSTGTSFTGGTVTGDTVFTSNVTASTLTTRLRKRITAVSSSAKPELNTDVTDIASLTGLATNITNASTNLTGTPAHGDLFSYEITDNGVARTITWGASFSNTGTLSLPTTTVISTLLRCLFQFNSVTSKWEIVAVV